MNNLIKGEKFIIINHLKVKYRDRFVRNLCENHYCTMYEMYQHMKLAHDDAKQANYEIMFGCILCEQFYSSKHDLNLHIKHVHGESNKENIPSLQCNYKTTYMSNLVRHVKSTDVSQLVPCEYCNKHCDKHIT